MKDRRSWSNWAGNQSCAPSAVRRPTTEAELVAIVRDAARNGQRVKCVGAGHSFTSIACTDGVMVDLSGYRRILGHDPETRREFYSKQEQMDVANAAMSKKAAIKRAETKSNSKVYNNAGWDLVDRAGENEAEIEKIDKKTLPDSLQNKTTAQLKVIVNQKKKERAAIQTKIIALNQQRQQYINDQKKNGGGTTVSTLETEVERIIGEQVKRFRMSVK